MTQERKVGGVLGGLGPQATVLFMQRVIDNTEVEIEQDHVDLIVTQRSSTPDRTASIFGRGPSPAPRLRADAQLLQAAGADFLVMPCNTASWFKQDIKAAVQIPVLSIVNETIRTVRSHQPGATTLGLLATDGTLDSKVYGEAVSNAGFSLVTPTARFQDRTMSLIYDNVKVGKPVNQADFTAVIDHLLEDCGADCVVLGCTELSVLYNQFDTPSVVFDSTESLARATVTYAGARLRPDPGSASH